MGLGLYDLYHRLQRQHELGIAHADQKAVDDGQRQRQAYVHGQAFALHAVQLQVAAQGLDVAAHHVHAHTPAGQVRHLFRSGEAGLENQHVDGVIGGHHAALHQTPVPGPLQHAFAVDATAVVLDTDQDGAGLVACAQGQVAQGRLARLQARLRRLQPVVQSVAHQVHERVGNLLHHGLVQLGLTAQDVELHFLAQTGGGIAHHALEAVEGLTHRHHAQAQGAVADLFDQPVHVLVGFGQGLQQRLQRIGLQVFKGRQGRAGAGTGNHQLAQEVDHRVQAIGLHTDEAALIAGLLVADFLLLAQGRLHQLGCDTGLLHQQGAQAVLVRICALGLGLGLALQHRMQSVLRDRTGGHQQVAQARHLRQLFDVAADFLLWAFQLKQLEGAIVLDKAEGLVQLGLGRCGVQLHDKAHVAAVMHQGVYGGHLLHVPLHVRDLSQGGQVARHGHRVHAAAKGVHTKLGRNAPEPGGRGR